MKTIEQMAVDAGFDATRSKSIYANEDGREQIDEQLQSFAALVAERCAEIVDAHSASGDGLVEVKGAILAEFPKP